MPELSIRTTGGGEITLGTTVLERFADALDGTIVTMASPEYEEARRIWNGMIARRPAMLVRCQSSGDVQRSVRFAREHGLLVSIRGGGHNIAGNALADGGMVIDLSPMRNVRVDADGRTARVEPGALLADLDREAQAHGLATPLGINSTTGVAGLTLGGGYGWLSRRFGLTADNLRSATMVMANGEQVRVSDAEDAELFWAIRGGGGNFGVVTSFEFQLFPVGPEVMAGLIVHPFDDAPRLLRGWADAMAEAPDELTVWTVMRKAPPLPFLPAEVHGREVLVLAVCYTGPMEDAERVLRPIRAIGQPHADVVAPAPYAAFQQAFDPLLVPGARNYWKTHNFTALDDELLETLAARVRELPGPECEIFLACLGGAVSRVPDDATAYMGRDARFVMNVHARWQDAEQDERCMAWARDVWNVSARFASAGAYVNFMTSDEQDRVRQAYGSNYERLALVKARVDPTNLFRVNQNIRPAPVSAPDAAARPGAGSEARPTA